VSSTPLSANQEEVLGAVRALRQENDGPVRTAQVRERTGKGSSHTSDLLGDLVDLGKLAKLKRGIYDLPEFAEDEQSERRGHSQAGEVSRTTGWPVDHSGVDHGGSGSSPPSPPPSLEAESPEAGYLEVDDRLIRSYLGYVPDPDEAFFFRIEGDSMQPWLSEGEYVLALRTDQVTVPGRYVTRWGESEAQVCVHLSPLGKHAERHAEEGESPVEGKDGGVIQLKTYGPQETLRLCHLSGRSYETGEGTRVQMQIRGRVVWPLSTPRDVMETVTDQMAKVLERTAGS
jgi:hypothetical protein